MELTTRCPDCGTVFGANLEQMRLRKGYIRCVSCGNIFDGFDAVVDAKTVSAEEPSADTSPQVLSPVVIRPRVSAGQPAMPAALASGPDTHFIADSEAVDDVLAASGPDSPAIFIEPRAYRGVKSAGNEFLTDRHRVRSGGSGFMRWLVVLLVLLVAASLLTYAFRIQIAAQAPQLRPLLETACDSLDCTVDYPRRIDRISIMDSSLQPASAGGLSASSAASGAAATDMVLTVVMRNTYDQAQQWPALTLDLVDFSGAVVARRILQPADYLDSRQIKGPFESAQEVRLTIPVATNGLKVNGYQLGKIFPPKD